MCFGIDAIWDSFRVSFGDFWGWVPSVLNRGVRVALVVTAESEYKMIAFAAGSETSLQTAVVHVLF